MKCSAAAHIVTGYALDMVQRYFFSPISYTARSQSRFYSGWRTEVAQMESDPQKTLAAFTWSTALPLDSQVPASTGFFISPAAPQGMQTIAYGRVVNRVKAEGHCCRMQTIRCSVVGTVCMRPLALRPETPRAGNSQSLRHTMPAPGASRRNHWSCTSVVLS